jgi:BlaR1 peptidase M56
VDRELVFLILGALTLGPLLLRAGVQPAVDAPAPTLCRLERDCWRRLWAPLLPAVTVFGALVGWALIEPDDAELLPLPLIAIGMPFLLLWMRAAVRALWGLRRTSVPTAATLGLLRPRVVIAPQFMQTIDDTAQHAVRAHEAAHARHRDPLRVWAAQFATDLQWPGRGATDRLAQWRHALELARDEEVRRHGIDGADLAAAVIAALQFANANASHALSIVGSHERVRERIITLLAPLSTVEDEWPVPSSFRASAIAGPLGAVAFGATFGEAIVRALVQTIP